MKVIPHVLIFQVMRRVSENVDGVNLDAFSEALLEKLVSLQGHRNPGAHVGEWLLERNEVADVFASDDELDRDLRG